MKLSCDYHGSKEALERFKKVLGFDIGVMKEADVNVSEEMELDLSELAGPSGVCNSMMLESSEDVAVDRLNVSRILEVEAVAPTAELDQLRYRHFMKFLHKWCAEKNEFGDRYNSRRIYLAKPDIKITFNNAEIDACITKMADENKVMRSEDMVFML